MSFVLIDLDGSTLEEFETADSVRRYLRRALAHDSTYADDLAVLEYRDDRRVGRPVAAHDFMADPVALVARASALSSAIEIVTTELIPLGGGQTQVSIALSSGAEGRVAILAGRGQIPRPRGTAPLVPAL